MNIVKNFLDSFRAEDRAFCALGTSSRSRNSAISLKFLIFFCMSCAVFLFQEARADNQLLAEDSRNRALLLQTPEDRPTWYLDLNYEGGAFSDQFIELIFAYGSRESEVIAERKDIGLLVQDVCGGVTEANVKLFSKVLEEQGFTEVTDEATFVVPSQSAAQLPPCLPYQEVIPTGRVVLNQDFVYKYYTADTSCSTCSVTTWRDSDDLVEALERDLRTQTIELAESFRDVAAQELDLEQAGMAKIPMSRVAIRFADPTLDDSQIAFRVLIAILQNSIDNSLEVATKSAFEQLEKIRPISSDQIIKGLEPTLAHIANSNFSPAEYMRNLSQISKAYEKLIGVPNRNGEKIDYRSNVLRFSAGLVNKSSVKGVGLGDIVFTPVAIRSTERIPIDLAMVANANGLIEGTATAISAIDRARILEESKAVFQTLFTETEIFVEQAAPTASLNDALSVTFTSVAPNACTSSDPMTISDTSMMAALLEHAFHTRLHLAKRGVSPEAVSIAIADSGFVSSFGAGVNPFAWSIDSQSDWRDWMPVEGLPPDMRLHGTEVAGVAIGGPGAWDLSDAIGVDLQIVPGRIYGASRLSSMGEAEVRVALLEQLLGSEPNIINLSVGERSVDGSDGPIADAIEDELKSGAGPLFVVAAGNNGANHLAAGQPLETTRLYPQSEGATSGVNILVVGALDGSSVARFSNFSDRAVSLLAPGCKVKTWHADDQASPYIETEVSGTSFSAPLVSFVAALVRSMSPPDRQLAKYVRARILASSDLHADLVEKATHGRVLNPAKAILLFDDVVDAKLSGATSASLYRGSFQPDISLQRLCLAAPAQNGALLKFAKSPLANANGRYIFYLWNEAQGIIDGQCLPRQSVLFKMEGEAAFKALPLTNVNDIVFQWRDQS